jgi:cytochrome c553
VNELTLSLEAAMLAANASASALDASLGIVDGASQTLMCSDCCGSNGNSCAPTLPK